MMTFSLITVGVISSIFFVFPEGIKAQSEENVFVTHSGGVFKTTGEIIDPLYVEATMEFDPMEYLRDFDYGKTSTLPDGTTLREYTIVAEDDKNMEVS
ncbi:MAG: copper oxidase, partial [Nitrosopumilus sp.]|nr:copper oxidase [Nitrosopumilus sp.]